MPKSSPTIADTMPARMMAIRMGIPRSMANHAAVNAPRPINAAWAIEISPALPDSRFRPIAEKAKIVMVVSRES